MNITCFEGKSETYGYCEDLVYQTELTAGIGLYIYNEQLETYSYISPGFAQIFGVTPDQYMEKIQSVEDDLSDHLP